MKANSFFSKFKLIFSSSSPEVNPPEKQTLSVCLSACLACCSAGLKLQDEREREKEEEAEIPTMACWIEEKLVLYTLLLLLATHMGDQLNNLSSGSVD